MKSEKLFEGIGYIDEKWLSLLEEPVPKKVKPEKRFVGYELKKLLGVRYLWVFLLVFLIINSFIAWYTAGKTPAANEPAQLISGFFEEYSENPEELDTHYSEILAFNEEQNELFREAMREGNNDFEPETMPSLYSDDESYPDKALFAKLYGTIEAARDYPDVLDSVIKRARDNLDAFADMGIEEDSFTYRYQSRVIELYELTRDNVKIEVEYTRGWDEYFSYDTVNIFIFMILIILGSLVFAEEKQNGFLPIIRASKNGRGRTAGAKIMTMLLLSCVFTLMFTLSTFAVYGLRLGYSSPGSPLQSLSSFTLSPYRISVGQYFAVTIGVKLLTFALFSVAVLALSVVFYNHILTYITSLAFFGVNLLMYSLNYINADSVMKNLNLVALSSVNPLFVRYRAMNLFGSVAGYVRCMLVLCPVLIALCTAFISVCYIRGRCGVDVKWVHGVTSRVMLAGARVKSVFTSLTRRNQSRLHSRTRPHMRQYSGSLVLAETFKSLISSRFIVILILLLAAKVWYSYETNSPTNSYSDAVYREYMTVLEGEMSEEKLDYIAGERAMINEALGKQSEMQRAYADGDITFDEYREYLSEYNYAYSRTQLLERIERHAEYLIENENETGVRGWFMYDTGWSKIFSGQADLFLYAAILLLLTGTFASEYTSKSSSGGFSQLLRTTKNGRHKTFSAKLVSSGVMAVALAALTCSVDVIIISIGYDLPSGNAPLMSMELFSDVTGEITVAQYFALFFVIRIFAALVMAMLVCALSELLAKYIPVLGTAVVLTLLPSLCAYFGLAAAEKISFLNMLAGTPLFLQSVQTALFGNGYAMLVLWLLVAAAASLVMLLPAKRMFVK